MGRIISRCGLIFLCGVMVLAATSLHAQQPSAPSGSTAASSSQGGLYLVYPFANAGATPRLDWLGEGLEELSIQYLSAAGEEVYSHAGRAGELERYGLPTSAKLSRATMLRIAQDLDADYVILGSFTSDGTSLTVTARVLRVDPPALTPPVQESGPLDSLMELHQRVVWRLLSANDHTYAQSLKDFAKNQRSLRLDAFEHYIRGILANEDEPRLRELHEAERLEPNWPDPAFSLGETYAARNDCSAAIAWFAKVPKTHPRYVEAVFATGVCRLQLGQPDRAEEVFTSLQDTLRNGPKDDPGVTGAVAGADLPEILNNLAIALARQGKTTTAESNLRRAVELDPDEDDYPFNLGLLTLREGDFKGAVGYFREASEREPDNAENRALLIQALEKSGDQTEADQEREAAVEALGPNALPTVRVDAKGEGQLHLDRIKNELDITAIRLEIESSGPAANPAATDGAAETAGTHIRRGRQELAAGHLDAAETEIRAALALDPTNPAAHRELADVDRRRGKVDDAVKELQTSLDARDSAVVRTMLARIYLDQKKTDLARAEVERALKLAPNYTEAKQLLEHLQNSKPQGGAQ